MKKIISLILVLMMTAALAFSLSSCKDNDKVNNDPDNESNGGLPSFDGDGVQGPMIDIPF